MRIYNKSSYAIPRPVDDESEEESGATALPRVVEEPAVKQVIPEKHVPAGRKKGLIARIFGSFFGQSTSKTSSPEKGRQPQRETEETPTPPGQSNRGGM